MSKKAKIDVERCKECSICIANCAKNAIEMTNDINSKGYKHIKIDDDKCVGCGICYIVCPDGVFEIVEEA